MFSFIYGIWNKITSVCRWIYPKKSPCMVKQLQLDHGYRLELITNNNDTYLSIWNDQKILVPEQKLLHTEEDDSGCRYKFGKDYLLTCSTYMNDASLLIENRESGLSFEKVCLESDDIEQLEPLFF